MDTWGRIVVHRGTCYCFFPTVIAVFYCCEVQKSFRVHFWDCCTFLKLLYISEFSVTMSVCPSVDWSVDRSVCPRSPVRPPFTFFSRRFRYSSQKTCITAPSNSLRLTSELSNRGVKISSTPLFKTVSSTQVSWKTNGQSYEILPKANLWIEGFF